MRTFFVPGGLAAAAIVALSVAAGSSANAGTVPSDVLTVFDGTGAIFAQTIAPELGEDPTHLYTVAVEIDPNQFGKSTVLLDPGQTAGGGQYSDIVGVARVGGALTLAFVSDSDSAAVSFVVGPNAIFLPEAGPIDVTQYLSQKLQAAGWTATFSSDVDTAAAPLPSTWSMMLIGLAALGLLAYHRSRKDRASVAFA
jgi:hypothetical protein